MLLSLARYRVVESFDVCCRRLFPAFRSRAARPVATFDENSMADVPSDVKRLTPTRYHANLSDFSQSHGLFRKSHKRYGLLEVA